MKQTSSGIVREADSRYMLTIFLRRHKAYLLRRLLPQKATGKQCAQPATAILRDGRLHSARSERLSLCVDWVLTSDPDGAHGAVHAAWLHSPLRHVLLALCRWHLEWRMWRRCHRASRQNQS